MKLRTISLGTVTLMLLCSGAWASVFYVNAVNLAPTPPFTTWTTAATNIQDAIDAAGAGDTVLVTNGVYAFGGRVISGDLTNRVALTNALTVQSVNGPLVTTIQGGGATNGNSAIRCAWLTNGASLVGFTLIAGATRTTGDTTTLQNGGAVWCASSNSLVSNCMILSNTATQLGGGSYQGTLQNSLLCSNRTTVSSGGTTYKSVLVNCTIVSNATYGAASPLAMTNCIIYYNIIGNYSGSGSAYSHCCITPSLPGTGNFTTAPQLFADGAHLAANSPCIGTGVNVATGSDIFGMPWSNPPSIGCAEWQPSPLVSPPQIKLTGNPVGFSVGNLAVSGISPFSFNWLKDGAPLQDNEHFSSTQTSKLAAAGVFFVDAGGYQLVVSNAFGVVTSSIARLVLHYVDVHGPNPVAPYTTWMTAATNIQDAITESSPGEIVLVTNGLYASGAKSMDGVISNRVVIDRPILVQSVSGPGATTIQGAWDPATIIGPGAVRCAWLTNNAILSGFTICGGATRANSSTGQALSGGGVWGSISIFPNNFLTAIVANCVISNNVAESSGGGAYRIILNNCLITANNAMGMINGGSGGSGGGAESCNLNSCALTGNSSYLNGAAADGGSLVNCTISANSASGYTSSYGAAVYGASLTNCIVFGNSSRTSYPNTNYASCTMVFCCSDPLPSGTGNINVNPQLLADNIHVTATSPCIGMGLGSPVSGLDIDGQPWSNPPSIGCDEWQPAPVFGVPLVYQINSPAHGLTFTAIVAGQPPFTYLWSQNGTLIQDDGHHSNSGTASLTVNNFGPADGGVYQVIATNASGAATSQVAQVVVHAVDAAGTNPLAPYSSWATAANTIQDAINSASGGDIVLVTNGVYATGGKVMAGDLTNRVAIDRAITVMSVNGFASTAIQGAWDPATTNGPGAVRCAYVADGAVLTGFTLQNGATRTNGDSFSGGPLETGGGVFCNSTNGVVVNCVLSNNSAIYGGGIGYGTLNNSLVHYNLATSYGGGTYFASLNNCTVKNNLLAGAFQQGAGTYDGVTRNSIVTGNYYSPPVGLMENDYSAFGQAKYSFSCTQFGSLSGADNIFVNPKFVDWFHIALASPCYGAGNALYAAGTDLDGETWAGAPSMGCDEMIAQSLGGPLSVAISANQTNLLKNFFAFFGGQITGRASGLIWSFGDGTVTTNIGPSVSHKWSSYGDFTVTFKAFNNDNPGVSASAIIHVQPLSAPQLQSALLLTNGFQFRLPGQSGATYTVQYTTNLISTNWSNLKVIYNFTGGDVQVIDPVVTNIQRFYRVQANPGAYGP